MNFWLKQRGTRNVLAFAEHHGISPRSTIVGTAVITGENKSGLYRQCAGAGEVRERGNAGAPVHCRYGLL